MDPTKSGARPKAANDAAKLHREEETAREVTKIRHKANSSELHQHLETAAVNAGDKGDAPTPADSMTSGESANDDAGHGDAGEVMQETGIAHASVTGAASAGTGTTLAQPSALSELTPVAFEQMLRRIVQDMMETM